MTQVTWDTVLLLRPELLLVVLALWTYVAGAFSDHRNGFNIVLLAGLALCGYMLAQQDLLLGVLESGAPVQASGPLTIDAFGHTMRWFVLIAGGLMFLTMWRASSDELSTEYMGSFFLVLAGLMLVCRANELILLFLGLELVSIPTYIMLYIGGRQGGSHEATAKYFYLSILSSGLLLYGFAMLYGVTGTLQLTEMPDALATAAAAGATLSRLAPAALVLILAGLGFKMAVVPFHFYAPDVYEGTTAANAGFLSVAPKIAGLVALLRILLTAMPDPDLLQLGWEITLTLALVTMTLGNVLALLQKNVRRMMAYSAIAHAGYLFIGVAIALAVGAGDASTAAAGDASTAAAGDASTAAAGDASTAAVGGISATLFYLAVYAVATLGIFAAITYLAGEKSELNRVDELSGMARSQPLIALAMAVCLFSLTGVPPLAGFWGKFQLLLGALCFDPQTVDARTRHWFLTLVIVGAINAAISAGYYLRIVGVLYFGPATGKPVQPTGGKGPLIAAVASALFVVAIGVMPSRLLERTNRAAEPLQQPVTAGVSGETIAHYSMQ